MKNTVILFLVMILVGGPNLVEGADVLLAPTYRIGINDVLNVSIIKPDKYETSLTVAPDGTINFPYIGNISVKDSTVLEVQKVIVTALMPYMTNPVVLVSLTESRNRVFFAYGEVMRPGSYPMNDNLTVIEALSMAGGFSKFASASKVKVIRRKPGVAGKEIIAVDLNSAMSGQTGQDILIESGDVITVSEGIF